MKRLNREDGATLVEMAFVLPVLILLIFGSLEFGLAFKERLTVASAAASAGRTGATMGTELDADIRILEALEVGLYDQVDIGVIVSVEIFKADPVTGTNTGLSNLYLFDGTDPTCMQLRRTWWIVSDYHCSAVKPTARLCTTPVIR